MNFKENHSDSTNSITVTEYSNSILADKIQSKFLGPKTSNAT